MLLSLALIFLCAFVLSGITQKLKLPGLLGMLITGVVLGPYVLDLIAPEILNISADLRQAALIIILVRAGLSLDISALKKVGRSAILMCFIPATVEIAATVMLAPLFFDITYLEAALMGIMLAAASPAVIVPRMIKLMENEYGTDKSIPQLIMAGASVNGIYIIVLFTSFMGMAGGDDFNLMSLGVLPIGIVIGLLIGVFFGLALSWLFQKIRMRNTVKSLVTLSAAFLLVGLETPLRDYVPMSGFLAVIALGGTILRKQAETAKQISDKFSKIWIPAEIMLFVLIGAAVNMTYAIRDAGAAIALIFVVLGIRFLGVVICLVKTNLNRKERLFCCIAYMPKATVQAAVGALPLAAGIAAGNIILTVAVWAILITAPLGALGIDVLYKKTLLTKR